MKILTVILAALTATATAVPDCYGKDYDLCVFGGTASGVIAAYSAACLGMDVVLVEPGEHIGGMTAGGLGFTDIGNKQVVTGLARQFYRKAGEHYGRLEQWIFEPHVASEILDGYLSHPRITVMKNARLENVRKSGTSVRTLILSGGRRISAGWFIDCSYEGDLMAGAGVSYVTGREDNAKYGETYDGVQMMTGHQFPDGVDPYRIPGDPSSGLLWGISGASLSPDGTGDTLIQAYNYRICLTDSLENMIPITRPENYDSTRYELLLRLFEAQPEKRKLNDYFIWSRMPNRKTDINNRGGFSTDMIGMNYGYPEADYDERERIVAAHRDYTMGLLYFYGHDKRVPRELREEMLRWGYPKDEYVQTGHWTPQLYVREARRMTGEYVATQADCQGKTVPEDGIALAAYNMDSHNCQRIVVRKDGRDMVKNEGNVEIPGGLPYPVSYRSLTPKRTECTNLLVPVCLSASHIAYGSIRMEPVFMVLGQVSAIASWTAWKDGLDAVQDVDYRTVNAVMRENPYLDGETPEILIDDSSETVSFDGDWKLRRMRGGYGASFLENAGGKGSAVFGFTVPETAEYDVYSYQHSSTRLYPVTAFEIRTGGGTYRTSVDMRKVRVLGQTSGEWCHIGKYAFEKGREASVTVSGGGGILHADAILLIRRDPVHPSGSLEARIDSVMAGMTMEEKIGQLNQLDGRRNLPYIEELLRTGGIGSIMNITDPDEVDRLQKIAIEESRTGIPVIFARDVVHGFRTMLPIPLGLAATFNENIVREGSRMAASEAWENGIRWAFAPMIDVSRDARWGRIAESFGEDVLLNSRLGSAVVAGYQTDSLGCPYTVAACAKHFIGYGAVEGGRDYNTTNITERQLREVYLPPFKAAADAGCASMMTSFNDIDGLPASANGFLLDSILRKEWNYTGVTVSDYGAIGELVKHGVASDRKDAGRIAMNAGTDMDMATKIYPDFLMELIEEGSVPMEALDSAVRRVLRLKFRAGLFDRPYTGAVGRRITGCMEHLDLAERAAEESVVLLKNDGGVLPLDGNVKTVLVTGPLSDSPHDQLGTWTMDGDTSMTVTPLDAVREKYGDKAKVIYEPGLLFSRDRDTSGFAALRRKAAEADVILAFMGEEAILSGEAHSLADISLKGKQSAMMSLLAATGKPVVMTIMAGRPVTAADEIAKADAVLYSFHPGTMGGPALMDIIFGKVCPSGKLPVSMAVHVGQYPLYYSQKSTGRPAARIKSIDEIPRNAGQSVLGHSSYYLDVGVKPLYPFGYGRSYTEFSISEPAVEKKDLSPDDTLRFSVVVSNTGDMDGAEVVQVYVRDVNASVSRPVRELKDFEKVFLGKGESRKINFSVPVRSFSMYDIGMRKVVEPGRFDVFVGNSSEAGLSFSVNVGN